MLHQKEQVEILLLTVINNRFRLRSNRQIKLNTLFILFLLLHFEIII